MAAYITGRRPMDGAGRAVYRNNTDFNSFGTYPDPLGQRPGNQLRQHLQGRRESQLHSETGYIHLWLDEGTWGRYENIAGDSLNYKGCLESQP